MKIILSPAKKMIADTDNLAPVELPVYIDKTAEVLNWIKSKSKEELKAIWKCNCLLYTSPSPRDLSTSRMPSSA